jgi:hypothetical protein
MASENDQGCWGNYDRSVTRPNLAQRSCIDKLARRGKGPGRSGPFMLADAAFWTHPAATLPLGQGPHDASVTDCLIDARAAADASEPQTRIAAM